MSVAYWQDASAAQPVCEVDILIVGAGIAGWSVAYWLRDEGLSVAVLDRGDRCAGATGRNAGFATCGSVEHYARQVAKHGPELARELWALSEENLRLLRKELVDRGVECDFVQRGTYSLAGGAHELEELARSAELMASEGIRVSMVDEAHVREHLGARGFAGGALYHDDGELHPVKLVTGMAERSGAAFYPHHEVHRMEQGPDGVDVWTQRRRFRAQAVVLATNGYSYLLDPWFADRIYPTRGQIIVTEPAPPFLAAPCYANFVLDYFRQLPDGRVLIGGFRQLAKETEVGSADEPNPVIQAALEAFLEEHFEALHGKRIEYRWAGIMGFSVDGVPLIGSLPGKPSVYFVGGFTAHGIGFAFKAGQLTARLITRGEAPGPLSARRLR
ncbi:MAG: FAD-dependent oxidoreductase [Myxococcales bacterium]